MPRTKTGYTRRRRHKKILKATKGYRGTNNRLYKRAHEAYLHAGQYAYVGRKLRKRNMRRLWIQRINAAVRMVTDGEMNYSRFIHALKQNNVTLNRKMLAELAVRDIAAFTEVVESVRG